MSAGPAEIGWAVGMGWGAGMVRRFEGLFSDPARSVLPRRQESGAARFAGRALDSRFRRSIGWLLTAGVCGDLWRAVTVGRMEIGRAVKADIGLAGLI